MRQRCFLLFPGETRGPSTRRVPLLRRWYTTNNVVLLYYRYYCCRCTQLHSDRKCDDRLALMIRSERSLYSRPEYHIFTTAAVVLTCCSARKCNDYFCLVLIHKLSSQRDRVALWLNSNRGSSSVGLWLACRKTRIFRGSGRTCAALCQATVSAD